MKKNGKSLLLKAKTFDLLVILVENRDRILTKDEILEKVWAGQFVEENNLTVQMSALRKALCESKTEPRFLSTIPGKGYKFIAAVHVSGDERRGGSVIDKRDAHHNGLGFRPEAPPGPAQTIGDADFYKPAGREISSENSESPNRQISSEQRSIFSKLKNPYLVVVSLLLVGTLLYFFVYLPKSRKTIESIAVLPLINVGADSQMDYLSDGITENLINDLSQSPNLKVIARNSAFLYKTIDGKSPEPDLRSIASKLGVQAVLTGRVEKRGDDLLISVELVDGTDNTSIWGEHYNRKFAEVFSVQEEIAREIAGKLRLKLTGEQKREIAKRYTDNIKAFENYTMGRASIHKRTREDLLTAQRYYERAIKEDPNYALAYTGLAEAYGNLGVRGYMPMVEGRRKQGEAARRALELDDNLAEAHAVMGAYYMTFAPYNFPAAESELRRAIEISPSLAIAHLYLSLSLLRHDQIEEGGMEMLKARELDPFSAIIAHQVGLYYYLKGDHSRALQTIRQANEMGPAFTTVAETGIYVRNGAFKEGLTELDKESQKRKDDPILISGRGIIYAAQGKRAEALAIVKELEELSGSDFREAQLIAKIYATLGEKEEAVRWLQRAVDADSIGAFYKEEPVWDAIRNDPRFPEMLQKMGILK